MSAPRLRLSIFRPSRAPVCEMYSRVAVDPDGDFHSDEARPALGRQAARPLRSDRPEDILVDPAIVWALVAAPHARRRIERAALQDIRIVRRTALPRIAPGH